jgi:hypothetical protein
MPAFTKNTNATQCSQIQINRTRCTRVAEKFLPKTQDPTLQHALCKVCWLLKGSPKEYAE